MITALLISSVLAQPVQLVRADQQSGAPIKKLNKTGWVGLWSDRLIAVKLVAEPFHHPIDDEDKPATVKTGVTLKAEGEADMPLVFIKGLAPRAVKTLISGDQLISLSDPSKPVVIDAATFDTQRVGTQGHRLVLNIGAAKQTLFEAKECDVDGWAVHFVGDLDGDGKLDFLISADTHYAIETLRLFLSTRAKKGELVHEVAKVSTTGC